MAEGTVAPSELPDKRAVIAALRAALDHSLRAMSSAARDAAAAATHEESRAEGDKDTRATEQSYIARGQAMRAEAIGEELGRLDAATFGDLAEGAPVRVGALVAVRSAAGDTRAFLVAPFGAGTQVRVAERDVTVVSPSAPVGSALLGKAAGDEVELPGRGGAQVWIVERVL